MILLTLIFACTSNKGDDTSSGSNSNTETQFEPTTGDWYTESMDVLSDSCGINEGPDDTGDSDDSDTIQLIKVSDGEYSLVVDEELSFSCTLSGMNLSCAETTIENPEEGMFATLLFKITATSVLSSETEMTLSSDMEIDCSGQDCALFESNGFDFPCTSTYQGIYSAL
jgi:hypothetical protein